MASTMALSKSSEDIPKDVPIFLRKTFAMIDSCDPVIAGWSEDDNGETFVVKDPTKFETTIIPQFFKHSKFSSFVRQLNFYAFRKIKYVDSIRIDPVLEAATANFWRFRHEHFRKGRPDLLPLIKRVNGAKEKKEAQMQLQKPSSVTSSPVVSAEVAALKKRIDEMNQNIDALTAMVAKVNLKQEQQEVTEASDYFGAKRKKAEPSAASPQSVAGLDARPDLATSSTEMEDYAPLLLPDPTPISATNNSLPNIRETSTGGASDADFVAELFSAFEDEDEGLLQFDSDTEMDTKQPAIPTTTNTKNNPDPELMRRLGDAMAALPRNVQELIVERLIKSIASTEFVESCVQQAAKVEGISTEHNVVAVQTEPSPQDLSDAAPLAAATFAELLRYYTTQVQGGKSAKPLSKTLPIIPAHA